MNEIEQVLNGLPDTLRLWVLFASLIFSSILDLTVGASYTKGYWKHFFFNARFMLTAAPFQFIFGLLLAYVFSIQQTHHVGLFSWMASPDYWMNHPIYTLLITLLMLDFFEFVYHVMMHSFKRIWMFHAIHHSDMKLDTSTTLREHPGETCIRLAYLVVIVSICGFPFWAFFLRQMVQIICNVFAHSSFRFSPKLDRVISLLFVTPNTHHVHHHNVEPWTNANYGDIFSIWDHLFGTYQFVPHYHQLSFGLDTFPDRDETENMADMLQIPLGKYRPKPEPVDKV